MNAIGAFPETKKPPEGGLGWLDREPDKVALVVERADEARQTPLAVWLTPKVA
jgi:hypothetical protein